jgi:hypothetical protein
MFDLFKRRRLQFRSGFAALALAASSGLMLSSPAQAQVSGAIFTTDAGCTGVDLNIYTAKGDVYLNGGPTHLGAASLPDGSYYVKVTAPDGTLLGTSVGAGNPTPVVVSGGVFSPCLQLSSALITASGIPLTGYDDTPNAGGEYKVWVSKDSTFANSASKTDNFKVKPNGATPARLYVNKFYDTNANGTQDYGEPLLSGWKVDISGCINQVSYTAVNAIVDASVPCTVMEENPLQTNWRHTTTDTFTVTAPGSVLFGNVCLGAGGGLTLGFWSNKNGQALVGSGDLAMLVGLNLRSGNGDPFDPANYSALRTWLLNATATNMAYMLSAQLATMELNVYNLIVSGSALIYAPGTTSANSLGFATVYAVMSEANASLATNNVTVAMSSARTAQEALKNALDNANNNFNFVQAQPCTFSFN